MFPFPSFSKRIWKIRTELSLGICVLFSFLFANTEPNWVLNRHNNACLCQSLYINKFSLRKILFVLFVDSLKRLLKSFQSLAMIDIRWSDGNVRLSKATGPAIVRVISNRRCDAWRIHHWSGGVQFQCNYLRRITRLRRPTMTLSVTIFINAWIEIWSNTTLAWCARKNAKRSL